MDRLRKAGVIFGISVIYTRENVNGQVPPALYRRRCAVRMVLHVHARWERLDLALVPTPEQCLAFGKRIAELRRLPPIFLADFWNDGPAVDGWLAGGRRYLHILNSGSLEPWVFAHFGVDNIREKTILEAANSPFFRSIRERFPYNEKLNLIRPCMIIDNPQVLRDAVAEYVVRRVTSTRRTSCAIRESSSG